MLKKRFKRKTQIIIKAVYLSKELNTLLGDSLAQNHYISPRERISFLIQATTCYNFNYYFSCYQSLLCFFTYDGKVHNKAYSYSRFFLNKQLNKILIANTLK